MKPVRMGKRLGVQPNNKAALHEFRGRVSTVAGDFFRDQDLLQGALTVEAVFYFLRPKTHYGTGRNAGVLKESSPAYVTTRPDLDKCARALADALTGIAWRDDSQIVTWKVSKEFAANGEGPRTLVRILPLEKEGA